MDTTTDFKMSDTSSDLGEVFRVRTNRLQGESNFYAWKSVVTFHFKQHDLWDIISGATPRPASAAASGATRTPGQESWDSASVDGIALLHYFVDSSIHPILTPHRTGPEMWAALMRRFHHRDAFALLDTFNGVSTLRYNESSAESIPEYLDSFDRRWEDLVNRTADAVAPTLGSTNSLETALHVLATSEEAKIEFLISSLPRSLRVTAMYQKPADRKGMTFVDYRAFLLRVHVHREKKAAQALEEAQRRECTWCRSRGFESAGHGSNDCERLREFKMEKSGRRREQKRRMRRQRV